MIFWGILAEILGVNEGVEVDNWEKGRRVSLTLIFFQVILWLKGSGNAEAGFFSQLRKTKSSKKPSDFFKSTSFPLILSLNGV